MTFPELENHTGAGFEVAVPAHWERLVEPDPAVALVALEPDNGGLFRANLVVTVDEVTDETRWQQVAAQTLAAHLHDYLLLDEQDEQNGVRRLFHHLVPESGAVTAEQWTLAAGGSGFTLTASVATLDYDAKAELFASIARSFRPAGQRA